MRRRLGWVACGAVLALAMGCAQRLGRATPAEAPGDLTTRTAGGVQASPVETAPAPLPPEPPIPDIVVTGPCGPDGVCVGDSCQVPDRPAPTSPPRAAPGPKPAPEDAAPALSAEWARRGLDPILEVRATPSAAWGLLGLLALLILTPVLIATSNRRPQ